MNASELLSRLEAMGIDLVSDAGKLRVKASPGQLDDALKQAIGEHKPQLMALLAHRAAGDGVVRQARGGASVLSHFQERLWVMQRLDPDSTAFNLSALWDMPEGVAAARVVDAVKRVLARHDVLNGIFVDDEQGQAMRPGPAAAQACIDLRALSPGQQEGRVKADREQMLATPFDLGREAPMRCNVYLLSDDATAVLLCAHHIAVDAWSLALLRREIVAACRIDAAAGGAPWRYADFAAWQRGADQTPARQEELAWWADKLAGAPALSVFPADRSGALPAAATVDFAWDADLTAAVRVLCREEGATLYMALLAACAAVLRLHTGQLDVVLGSPMGTRERAEFETVVGPFVNLRVLRLDLGGDPGFATLLGRAREMLLQAHEHRLVPFETLLERLRPQRSPVHTPLFQMAVVQHNAEPQGDMSVNSGGTLHDITLFVRETEHGLVGTWEYRDDLYSPAAMRRVSAHVQTLVRAVVADRSRPVSGISLLGAAEQARLREFNATDVALDRASFIEQFERQAARAPNRVAVRHGADAMDYATLDRRANQLAQRLRALGAGPGERVGLCLERGVDLVVALLGIQKSGAAYVPLDPGFPSDRLGYMLSDSGARVLVTAGDAAAGIDVGADVQRLDVTRVGGESDAAPRRLHGPDDAVYLIYTSGSTGRPKGVAVPHGALANFLGSMRIEPGLAEDDVVAAVTTISFDIAGLELFLPLMVGARIELVDRDTAADGLALARLLETSGATVLQATPSTWRLLLEARWQPQRPLRALCGGEGLPRDLADQLLERVGELWNLYGPTETTVWSSACRVEPSPAAITIGRPIANTQIHVVDVRGEPLPVGLVGEICIGGDGVALGYHGRPELTAERFVEDRLGPRPGARLYRTGDLGRWDESGQLHHLGRSDHQVKIRGYRIELGEIESVLAAHGSVRQCLVAASEAVAGDTRLVAYVVYAPGEDLTASEVRKHLRKSLPDYMLPALVIALDAMPLTPNGKVDRQALPDPFAAAAGGAATDRHEEPTGAAEQALADVWREILKVERIGAQDNFFELGGHSLLAFRVAAAIRERHGWRMDPRALFFQTLRQVAAGMPPADAAGAHP